MEANNPIFNKAVQFLSRREYSEVELQQKLLKTFPEAEAEITALLHTLKSKNYLNNQRFLESRIRHRLAQGYGPERIIAELTQVHQLSRQDIIEALAHDDHSGFKSTLKDLVAKKAERLDLTDFKMRQKLMAYFLRRGFRLEQIKVAVQSVSAQSDTAFLD